MLRDGIRRHVAADSSTARRGGSTASPQQRRGDERREDASLSETSPQKETLHWLRTSSAAQGQDEVPGLLGGGQGRCLPSARGERLGGAAENLLVDRSTTPATRIADAIADEALPGARLADVLSGCWGTSGALHLQNCRWAALDREAATRTRLRPTVAA